MSEARTIAILAPEVAQRIAAGEVVERPASVVRELIENALDAGAGSIEIELRGAGLELIAVSDDGHGIAAGSLPLAFARHGTSKLRSVDDLAALGTLGFRGEALPSIASVGTVEIATAIEGDAAGASLLIREGRIVEQRRVARTRGTTVRVRDLFAGQPARRGFLPGARAENALIGLLVRRYALARPTTRFSLRIEGRATFRASGLGEVAALTAAYGQAASRLAPFGPLRAGRTEIAGFLGDPGLTRGDREGLLIVVNGRWVTPQRWLAALEAAYRTLMPRGRHPVALLRISIDPASLDVNLHPAKLEIRILDEDETLSALSAAIRAALGSRPAAAELLRPAAGQPVQAGLPRQRRLVERPAGYGADVIYPGRMRVLAQLHGRMILAEDDDGLYLVDQHRADERARFEWLADLPRAGSEQELISPLNIELRADQHAAMEAALPALAALGFRCERFGHRTFLVRAMPTGLPVAAGLGLAEALEGGALEGAGWEERIQTAVACHASVRRGVALTREEMEDLLAKLAGCEVRTICPHGSPIIARVGVQDLARHFDWT